MNNFLQHINRYILYIVLTLTVLNINDLYSQAVLSVNIKSGGKFYLAPQAIMIINGSLNNNSGATLNINSNIKISGNWTNDGNQYAGNGAIIEFFGTDSSEINGSGITRFYQILVNKNTKDVELRLNTALTDTPSGFVELRKGTFRIIGNYAISNKFLLPSASNIYIPGDAAFWLENPNAVVEAQLADIILNGKLKITSGIFNAGQSIVYNDAILRPGMEIEGGTLNVGNRISSDDPNSASKLLDYTQTGGTVNLAVAGVQTDNSPLFEMNTPASNFIMSGGEIVIKNENSNSAVDEFSLRSANNVTGGTLKIDVAAADQNIKINSTSPIGNLLMTGANNPQVSLSGNNLNVLRNVTIAGTGADRFMLNGQDLTLKGDWINNIAQVTGLNQGDREIIFTGDTVQNITGSLNPEFSRITVNKTAQKVVMQKPMRITNYIKLLGTLSLIDMQSNDLTLSSNAGIFSDAQGLLNNINSFNANKYIVNSGSGTNPLLGAKLIKEVEQGTTGLFIFPCPIGTPGVYSPAEIQIFPNKATVNANASIAVKVVPQEHPAVESNDRSLKRYWNVSTQNIVFQNQSTYAKFGYSNSDIAGSEGYYRVLQFSPEWNNPQGYWRIDPATGSNNNQVDFNTKVFYSQAIDTLNGDWTAGENIVASGVYYSRADGNYNDPNSWSRESYDGLPSATAPNKLSDLVYIQGHTITVNSVVAPAKLISVETGVDGRTDGVIKFVGENYVSGDTFKLQPNASIYVSSSVGISVSPDLTGNIRSNNRDLSSSAKYIYWGGSNQISGNGLPNEISYLSIEKPAVNSVVLSKNIVIGNTLNIQNGVLDMAGYSLNGSTSGRTFSMSGGEFIVRSQFPYNYTSPKFTAGKITFDGTGNITIPSDSSTPAVAQYYDVKVSSASRAGNVTLSGIGNIKIGHDLDLSQLNFANNSYKFYTDGSTVYFNSSSAAQNVQFAPASPNDPLCYLNYYNLVLDSSGIIKIVGPNTSAVFTVLRDIKIINNAQFDANDFSINIHGNWINQAGTFVPRAGTVIFTSDISSIATHVISRSTTDNPFGNVRVSGPGIVQIEDNFKANGNITIDSLSNFKAQNYTINIGGNWINNSGNFIYGTSTVIFNGTVAQNIIKSAGNENFYKLTVQNPNNVYAHTVGIYTDGIEIFNNLNLDAGNLVSHLGNEYRYIKLNGNITRTGGGFVDGEFRKNVDAGTITFEVGYNKIYTPVTLSFTGSGGTQGFIGVISDSTSTSSSPVYNSGTMILPLGSGIDPLKTVSLMYGINIPQGSTFTLGNNRTYTAKVTFDNAHINGAGNPAQFDMSLLKNGTGQWVKPNTYSPGNPIISQRTATTTQISGMKDFGTFIVGPPGTLTYYSRQNGNWGSANSWSLDGYGGSPAGSYPGEISPNFSAFIATGHSITLDRNVTINTPGIIMLDTISSPGKLMTQNYTISGTGEFRMLAYTTLGIGNSAGITNTGATGNIQTAARNYNYNQHNRGNFIYNGSTAQVTGNGLPILPDTISTLVIDKPLGIVLTNSAAAGQNLIIYDSLYVKSGNFAMQPTNGDIELLGNFRTNASAQFIANSRSVYFRGTRPCRISSGTYSEIISFDNLYIDKKFNTGNVILDSNTRISVASGLFFTSNNQVILDAYTNSSELQPLYVQIDMNAVVNGAAQFNQTNFGGWVWGEMRRYFSTGDVSGVKFETGTLFYYSPLEIGFTNNPTSNGIAGYLSGTSVDGYHPMLQYGSLINYPISKARQLNVFWRLKYPTGSTFDRGLRSFKVNVFFNGLAQATNTDCIGCADLSFYRGGAINNSWYNNQWQGMYTVGTAANNSGASGNGECADTRFPATTPNDIEYIYNGTQCGGTTPVTANIGVSNIGSNRPFGSSVVYSNGDRLLADFVAGNRNSIKYYTFYSVKNGNWSDPTIWSTIGYSDTTNPTNEAALDNDPLIRPVPFRQYDNAYIGNGKKVNLDIVIGTNYRSSLNSMPFSGPSVFVENTGNLDLVTSVIRGNQFNAKAGSTISIGAETGISNVSGVYTGNVQLDQSTGIPNFSDSINIVYSPRGKTVNTRFITPANRNSISTYITSVSVAQGGATFFNFATGDKYRISSDGTVIVPASFNVTAGQTYSITINSSNANFKYFGAVIMNYNGTWQTPVTATGYQNQTLDFTIPASFDQGTTVLRLMIGTNAVTATGAGTGEYEDYTIHINKANYVANQVPGLALPSVLKSLTVTTNNIPAQSQTVTLNKSITVLDSMKFEKATFNNGGNTISIQGDIISNNDYSFNAGTGTVKFIDEKPSNIRGNASITFNKLNLFKKADSIYIKTNTNINGLIKLDSANCFVLADNKTMTFGPVAGYDPSGLQLSKRSMIKVSGNASTGTVIKQFATGTAATNSFVFPVGIDTIYNPADISLKGNFAANNSLTLKLFRGKYPVRLTDNILNKYWNLQASNISNLTASSLKFSYSWADTSGNVNKYIPGRYNSGWEIDLGENPTAKPSPITVTNEFGINGNWTAGEPEVYYAGRIFYSKSNGLWENKASWSTDPILKHTGRSATYFPGELYNTDTVNIDGHTITYTATKNNYKIDSLRIGGTNTSLVPGILSFGNNASPNSLSMRALFLDADNGEINALSGGGADTISIAKSFNNLSTGNGINLRYDATNSVSLKFAGDGNFDINGDGKYTTLSDIFVERTGGLSDTLRINSTSFGNATAVASNNFLFYPKSGIIRNNGNANLYLSSEGRDVELGLYSGIDVIKLATLTRAGLNTNTNTTINVNGGKLNIGNGANENLLYRSGTSINLVKGEINVAAAFARYNTNAFCDVNIANDASNVFRVNAVGNTQADKIGFDLSNSASSVSMSNGRIIVANASGTVPSLFDLRINAAGGAGLIGGKIQSGDSILTPEGALIKIGGITPMYDLHFANAASKNVTSILTDQVVVIKRNWDINNLHHFNLSGNTIKLGGNLTNYGDFQGTPGVASTNPWLIEFNGSGDQTIFNNNSAGLTLYNIRVNKPTGNILLANAGNSNLIIKNTLEFTSANNSIISTQANNNRYVELSLEPGSTNQILRYGKGHIYGYLYRHISASAANTKYYIGGETVDLYRPLTFHTLGTNTAGLLGGKFVNSEHPVIANSGVDFASNMQKYWTLKLPATNAFALNTGQKYNLTLQYDKATDVRNNVSVTDYEQYMYSPEVPNSGQWYTLNTNEKTDSTSKSFENTRFGDVMLGVPYGLIFYSINSGNWNDAANWSNFSYGSTVQATRFPNVATDIIKIGNGKVITVPDNLNPEVRSVTVEKFNDLPGTLQINGAATYIAGNTFVLKDSCTLGVQHSNGINTLSEGARGAVITNSRNFGVSRYIFNSSTGSQASGNGVPNIVQSLIVDNSTVNTNKSLFLYNNIGVLDLKVNDTLNIRQGILNAGSRSININNTMRIDSVVNDGELISMAKFSFTGGGNKNLDLANSKGVRFHNLTLDNSNILAEHKTRRNTTLEHIYVKNNLDFIGAGQLILGDSVSIKVENSNPAQSITNFDNTKFIRTSKTSGSLIRTVAAGQSYIYPIGSIENSVLYYSPADLATTGTGATGSLGIRTSWGKNANNAHLGLATNALAKYIKRYWAVDSVTMKINGKLTFHYSDSEFLAGSGENDMTKIGRWRQPKERTPGGWSHPSSFSNLDPVNNTFSTNDNTNFADFDGDWLLGNDKAFRMIYYSRQSGNWNSDQSWTFDVTHSGPICGLGIFPNYSQDSVVIGGSDTINLNINNPFSDPTGVGIAVGSADGSKIGTLNLGTNILNGDIFNLYPNSTLMIGSPDGISALGSALGNIQTSVIRNFSNQASYVYNGNSNQVPGDGLPSTVKSIEVANSGAVGSNTVTFDRNIAASDNFTVSKGTADLLTNSISGAAAGSKFIIDSNAVLRIGGTNNPSVSIPGFSDYSGISAGSTFEFYGNGQDISLVPSEMYNSIGNTGLGYGNVLINGGDNQSVSKSILLRGNLVNTNAATLTIQTIDALQVRKSVINNAAIMNNGVLEIGTCQ